VITSCEKPFEKDAVYPMKLCRFIIYDAVFIRNKVFSIGIAKFVDELWCRYFIDFISKILLAKFFLQL